MFIVFSITSQNAVHTEHGELTTENMRYITFSSYCQTENHEHHMIMVKLGFRVGVGADLLLGILELAEFAVSQLDRFEFIQCEHDCS